MRNAATGNGYKLVPGAEDYTIPANESGRGFHTIDVMATRQHDGEYGDRSDNPLGVCAMNQNALVNGETLLNTTIALYYRVSVRDATANNWPPGCTGANCIPQDSMICKKNGPTLIPFGPWVDGGTPLPIATVTPTSYSFKLVAGGSANDALAIGNTGAVGSTLTYTITEAPTSCANPSDVSWLGVAPTSGSVASGLAGSASVTINTAGLATGSHSAKLCVATNDATHALIEVPVSLAVSAVVEPAVTVTPMELAFTVPAGLKDNATVTIANTGTAGSTLQWGLTEAVDDCFVTSDVEWLLATPSAGNIAAGSSTAVNVAIDATTLEPGSYPAIVCIVTNDPAVHLTQVPVALTVKPNLPDDVIFANGFDEATGIQPVQDPGFEATTGDGGSNPFWNGTDSNDPGGTPFYGADFGIPVYEGKWEVWFGGWESGQPESQSFSQTITIPSGGPRRLNYWRLIDTPPEGQGSVRISVDAVDVANVDLGVPADSQFVPQSIDVSAFADGAAHTITFTFQHDGNGTDGNTFIDQVTIDAQAAAPTTLRPRAGHRDPRLSKKRR